MFYSKKWTSIGNRTHWETTATWPTWALTKWRYSKTKSLFASDRNGGEPYTIRGMVTYGFKPPQHPPSRHLSNNALETWVDGLEGAVSSSKELEDVIAERYKVIMGYTREEKEDFDIFIDLCSTNLCNRDEYNGGGKTVAVSGVLFLMLPTLLLCCHLIFTL